MLDLLIHGGDVIDGTGGPRRRADVGVSDGRIVSLGEAPTEAAMVIDATGKVVSPGFIDVHTHYDAQVFWDPALTPSPLHGVTTALAGNCGFTIAPLSGDADDRAYLMRMLARVEGMPLESLREAVPWSWKSTGEYLDSLDGTLGINLGLMVGHSAIRRIVLRGEANEREATPDEIAEMGRLLHEGLDAGAIGFSSSWARTHNDSEGRMVPSRLAGRDELVELCRIAGTHPGTSLEFIPMIGRFEPWALDLMASMSAAAERPLNWNVLHVSASTAAAGRAKLRAADVARERGAKVVALTIPMNFGTRMSFASGFGLDAMPGWEEAMALPRHAKLAVFKDRTARDALKEASQHNPLGMSMDWSSFVVFDVVSDENRPYVGRTLGDTARDLGRDPWDLLCDIAVADELQTSFGRPPQPETDADWKVRAEVWRDGRAVIGGSDAGAHLDFLASFNYATILLAEAVRRHGVITLEEAIHLFTDVPARLYGLRQRGRIEQGWHADLVVLDPAAVRSHEITMRYDLPAGAGRLYAEADGIEHVLVNGRPVVTGGVVTAQRPGALLRSGRDTATPDLN